MDLQQTSPEPYRVLRDGQLAQLFVHDVATGVSRLRLTSAEVLFEAPNWTVDGSELIVNGHGRLLRLRLDGGDLEEIPLPGLPAVNNDHVLSPDGATVFVSCEDGHLYRAPLDGSGTPVRVSTDKGPRFRHYLHGVGPDGATLAYIGLEELTDGRGRTNVFLLDHLTRAERQLTDDSWPDDGAEFSPDGRWVYFNSERASSLPGHAQLFRVPASGGEPEQLTFDERVNWFPHPDPTGRRIAYVSFPPGTLGHPADRDVIVRILEPDGGIRDVMALPGGQGSMNVPSWSPDGSALAFVAYPLT